MKLISTVRLTGALLAGVLLSLFTANAFAANTASGTTISNLATVNYSVNSIAQTAIGSSSTGNTSGAGTATTFLVDDKLVLVVTTNDVADVNVTPGQTGAILVYKVTNNGNATQGVTFTTLQANGTANPFAGGVDDFDATGVSIFVSKNNTATYVPANDTASSIPQLAAGASNFVFVVANIPASQVDADVAVVALKGQVAAAGGSATYGTAPGANITTDDSGNAWTPGTVQNIFADAAGTDDAAKDGLSSSRDAYLVKSAKLTITKTSSVVSDPTGDAIPHAIPGAVIKYTITVANSGTTAATGITLADSISTQLASISYNVNTIKIADPNVSGGATQSCLDSGSTFGSDTCSFTAGTSTVNALINSLTNGQTATVTFTVTIL